VPQYCRGTWATSALAQNSRDAAGSATTGLRVSATSGSAGSSSPGNPHRAQPGA
jgi:hypothetical protein